MNGLLPKFEVLETYKGYRSRHKFYKETIGNLTMIKSLEVSKRVFKNWRYTALVLIVALAFYLINGLIVNIPNFKSFYKLFGAIGAAKLLISLAFQFHNRVLPFSLVTIIILGILIGVLISLLTYRYKTIDSKEMKKIGFFGTAGIFLGVAAPGCAACGVGLLSLLGLTSVLFVLPFQGREINVIAILIIGFAIIKISGKLYNPVCQVKINENA